MRRKPKKNCCPAQWRSSLVEDMLSRTDLDLHMMRPEGLPENLGLHSQGYYLSELQADAILRMSLRNLTGLDQEEIVGEYKNLMGKSLISWIFFPSLSVLPKSSAKNWQTLKPTSATNVAAKSIRLAAISPMKT